MLTGQLCISQTLRLRVGGQVIRVICHMLRQLLLIPDPLPHGAEQTDSHTPLFETARHPVFVLLFTQRSACCHGDLWHIIRTKLWKCFDI